ncbi:MAG: flippase-like domain-containing protein [bacterium]|nr:MAG: flippase-like domain-containing protein [bacterium]
MPYQITRKKVKRGLQIFSIISFTSVLVIFFLTRSSETAQALHRINPLYLMVALSLIVVDWIGGGYRIYIFGRVLHPGIRFKTCVRANLGNYFMAAVTPAQTGGGPVQIYIMYSDGVPVVEATSASLMTFLSTVFFLIIAAALTFGFKGRAPLLGHLLTHLFNWGIFLFLFIGFLVVLALVFPGMYRKIFESLFRLLSHLRKKDFFKSGTWASSIVDGVDRCHQQLVFYLRKEWPTFLLGIVLTGALFFTKFLIAYLVVLGLGVQASMLDILLLQVVITLINYFFPSPGGSGAAEFSAAALMAAVVPTQIITFYVILWRLFTTYLSVAAGGIVILHEFGRKERLELESGFNGTGEKFEEDRVASI